EAVGTLYEAAAGLDPLTRWQLPVTAAVQPAKAASKLPPPAKLLWRVALADRIVGLKPEADGRLSVLANDGTLATITAQGEVVSRKVLEGAELAQAVKNLKPSAAPPAADLAAKLALPGRIVKQAVPAKQLTAVSYWGGTLRIVDAASDAKRQQVFSQDITALAWLGNTLIVGLADGRLIAVAPE
ncbi:MAG: hypothetical protein ACYC0Y_27025, partial [Pirellulales bacterium]